MRFHHRVETREPRPSALRRKRAGASLLLAALLATVLGAGATFARADSPIEGVWSFNGGKVAIQAQSEGVFAGTVVAPTKFAQCTHPLGERMWTEMRRQPDGSYWGLHQWFFATEECVANPTLGQTAWRVLQTVKGASFLRACFSEPGSDLQPTIAPDGTTAGATFGCADSALISPLQTVTPDQFGRYVTLPSNKSCLARKTLRIRMRDPQNDPLDQIVVRLRSGQIHRRAKLKRHGKTVTATLNLKGLPAGSFTVTVRATTVLGGHLSGHRTYTVCGKRHRHKAKAHSGKRSRPHA